MADAMYNNYREEALRGLRTPGSETIKVKALTSSYTFSAAHTSVNDITSTWVIKTSDALTSKTFTDGVFDAADVTLTAVTGSAIASLVIYTEAGSSASSTLMIYIDSATGLPLTPNGGDVIITWDSGANKIFKL